MFSPLSFPKADLNISKKEGAYFVWCIIRKKKLVLTPEEWVRQHVIHFLINEKKVPVGLIASEFLISVNGLSRRCDIVVFDINKTPLLIVECKSVEVDINEKVLHQIAQYNFKLNTSNLFLTNGRTSVSCKINKVENNISYFMELPNLSLIHI